MRVYRPSLPRLLLFLVLASAVPALAAEATAPAGFTASLAATGPGASLLEKLSAPEKTELDRLVALEVGAAWQGGVTSFRGTFTGRRTATELAAAGLDRLSPAERTWLDERVAAAIASRPPAAPPLLRAPDTAGLDVRAALKPEVHGQVTLGYGWGRDGSYRFGSVDTYYYDPEKRVGLGVGVAVIDGRGRWCY